MDSDLWASRVAAAKRQYSLQQHQNSRLDRLMFDDFDLEEDGRLDFPCPYCYEDHDIASLCSHLEEEHAFESKATVCPICSVKITRDMLNHITVQHGHLFKISTYSSIFLAMISFIHHLQRRRRLRRVAMPNNQVLARLSRDLREAHLQVILGNGGYQSSSAHTSNASTDSLLSSLLNLPPPESEELPKSTVSTAEDASKRVLTSSNRKSSFDPSLSHEEKERKIRQAAVRATFVQDLLLTTLFGD
ncbi:unnamed protein product [Spirodela intermedia]|uniref:Uncharacterized protein n=1 Tax=Spirodela intermedia TaxID=51605 RepID=A0A7I8KKF1_SPIIN|nr:unnamed protein product [Spirodela intermedia]